jgi:tRNA(Ile)-lysidine synthase
MARRALGPATAEVVSAVSEVPDAALLVACSGGPDSLALAGAAALVAQQSGRAVRAVVVDHGLQPGSDEVAAAVVEQLHVRLGLIGQVVSIDVTADGSGPESSARVARYAALTAAAAAHEAILLGHTLDDQAETVLLGLARGSGTRSLAGMPAVRGQFVRPLLRVRRATTNACCVELGLHPWADPHNSEARFTRVRVRRQVLPVLEAQLGPGVAQALARTAELARADADLLDSMAADALAGLDPSALDCTVLTGLPQALLGRVLRDWLRQRGAEDVSAAHIAAVASLVTDWHGQRWIEVPGVRVYRSKGRLGSRSVRES